MRASAQRNVWKQIWGNKAKRSGLCKRSGRKHNTGRHARGGCSCIHLGAGRPPPHTLPQPHHPQTPSHTQPPHTQPSRQHTQHQHKQLQQQPRNNQHTNYNIVGDTVAPAHKQPCPTCGWQRTRQRSTTTAVLATTAEPAEPTAASLTRHRLDTPPAALTAPLVLSVAVGARCGTRGELRHPKLQQPTVREWQQHLPLNPPPHLPNKPLHNQPLPHRVWHHVQGHRWRRQLQGPSVRSARRANEH